MNKSRHNQDEDDDERKINAGLKRLANSVDRVTLS